MNNLIQAYCQLHSIPSDYLELVNTDLTKGFSNLRIHAINHNPFQWDKAYPQSNTQIFIFQNTKPITDKEALRLRFNLNAHLEDLDGINKGNIIILDNMVTVTLCLEY